MPERQITGLCLRSFLIWSYLVYYANNVLKYEIHKHVKMDYKLYLVLYYIHIFLYKQGISVCDHSGLPCRDSQSEVTDISASWWYESDTAVKITVAVCDTRSCTTQTYTPPVSVMKTDMMLSFPTCQRLPQLIQCKKWWRGAPLFEWLAVWGSAFCQFVLFSACMQSLTGSVSICA